MKNASQQEIVFLSGKRTPFGAYGGTLKDVSATDLGVHAAKAALAQSGAPPSDVGHVVLGNVIQTSPNAIYQARHVALRAGVPQEAPALAEVDQLVLVRQEHRFTSDPFLASGKEQGFISERDAGPSCDAAGSRWSHPSHRPGRERHRFYGVCPTHRRSSCSSRVADYSENAALNGTLIIHRSPRRTSCKSVSVLRHRPAESSKEGSPGVARALQVD